MKRNKLVGMIAGAALLSVAGTRVEAQVGLGYTDVGAVVGLGNLAGANLSFGGRFERVFKKLPSLGDGLLGIGVSADVYSYGNGAVSLRYIPIAGTANYHFKLDPKKKLDLFVGAGLGFLSASCSIKGSSSGGCGGFGSNLYFVGRGGGRYFLTPTVAAYADVGAGAATLNAGLTFKLK